MLPDVNGPLGVWVDLYAATGKAPGTRLMVYNKGSNLVVLSDSASSPVTASNDGVPCRGDYPQVFDQGSAGAWAKCPQGALWLNIQEYPA